MFREKAPVNSELVPSQSHDRRRERFVGRLLRSLLAFELTILSGGVVAAVDNTAGNNAPSVLSAEQLSHTEEPASLTTVTATLPPPPTTVSLSEVTLPPESPVQVEVTTTPLPPSPRSCEEIVAETVQIPTPPYYQHVCDDEGRGTDGLTSWREATSYFAFGDPEDSDTLKLYIVAHEKGHQWLFFLGLGGDEVPVSVLEDQADDFAFAFGYAPPPDVQLDPPYSGDAAGALAVCQLFASRGAEIC